MNIAIYTRVSTDGQDATNQVLELRQWAESKGHNVVSEYQDVASGARRREQLDDLFEAARKRKFDLVAIWALDRMSREGVLKTMLRLDELSNLGVKVYSHQEAYLDPEMPFYSVIVAFNAELARMERQRLSERTKSGLRRALSQGKKLGRPKGSKDTKKRRRTGYLLRYAE